MLTVWFIRHGESEANAGLPTLDPITTCITPRGHQQAQRVAKSLVHAPSLIVTSPYFRTKQTAQPTIDRFSSIPQEEWLVQEFTFLAPAHYHNTTTHERQPKAEAYWHQYDPFHVDGEGAESFAMLIDRVHHVRSKLEQFDEGLITIFSHGRFIRAFLWVVLSNPDITPKSMRQFHAFIESFRVPNGSILKAKIHASDVWFSSITTTHL